MPNAPADALALLDVDADGDADLLTTTGYRRNTRRQLHAPRIPVLGGDYTLELHWNTPAGTTALGAVFTGPSAAPQTIPGIAGRLVVDPNGAEVWATTVLSPGANAFTRRVPATAVLFGFPFVAQALIVDPSGARWSNTRREIVQ